MANSGIFRQYLGLQKNVMLKKQVWEDVEVIFKGKTVCYLLEDLVRMCEG